MEPDETLQQPQDTNAICLMASGIPPVPEDTVKARHLEHENKHLRGEIIRLNKVVDILLNNISSLEETINNSY